MNGIPVVVFSRLTAVPADGRRLPRSGPGGALRRAVGRTRAIGGIFWPACSVPPRLVWCGC